MHFKLTPPFRISKVPPWPDRCGVAGCLHIGGRLPSSVARAIGWVLVGLVGFSGIACSGLIATEPEPPAEVAVPAPVVPPNQVVALGRLVPQGEVIQLSVPNAADSRVNQVLVQEGDRVQPGQIIAILQGFERRQRDLEEAQKTVEYYQARLNQMKSGDAKQAELAAQSANIARLEAQLQNEILEREAAIDSAQAALRQAESTYDRKRFPGQCRSHQRPGAGPVPRISGASPGHPGRNARPSSAPPLKPSKSRLPRNAKPWPSFRRCAP